MNLRVVFVFVLACIGASAAQGAGIVSKPVPDDLSRPDPEAGYWSKAPAFTVALIAQPMFPPMPKTTNTANVGVQSVHNEKWISFRLSWKDADKSEGGRSGEFSDGVAIQFPVKSNENPPPVFMGAKDNPVYILHWRAQYQRDSEKGKPQMSDLYPNMSVDMYPMEFKVKGKIGPLTDEMRETFSPGVASGNPQSYAKSGVDEVMAEGFSTSSVIEGRAALGSGRWSKGEWVVVISRPLKREGASVLEIGKGTFVGFAAWQGGLDEVGSRKSVTMSWTPVAIEN